MKSFEINIPSTVSTENQEARMSLASKFYERGELTLGRAAELAGYTKETFMEYLSEFNVALITHSAAELDQDIENAQRHSL